MNILFSQKIIREENVFEAKRMCEIPNFTKVLIGFIWLR